MPTFIEHIRAHGYTLMFYAAIKIFSRINDGRHNTLRSMCNREHDEFDIFNITPVNGVYVYQITTDGTTIHLQFEGNHLLRITENGIYEFILDCVEREDRDLLSLSYADEILGELVYTTLNQLDHQN